MEFLIADTFTDSLTRLTGEEQKAVKTTAFDLQLDPSNPGVQFHKLDKAKDKNFWSVRVSSDIRLIVHRTDGKPRVPQPAAATANPFEHPDALRRFRVMSNVEELQRALDFPWEKWTVFLHPEQRQFVERDYNGPARVSGSAGTGKTIVALHRAAHLARANPNARILLTTFTDTLASALQTEEITGQ